MNVYYLALASVALVVAGGETRTPLLEIIGILILVFTWLYVGMERIEAKERREQDDEK